jgi:hypothetical protein
MDCVCLRFSAEPWQLEMIQLNRGVYPQQLSVTCSRQPYALTSLPPQIVADGSGENFGRPVLVQFTDFGTRSHGLGGCVGAGVGGGVGGAVGHDDVLQHSAQAELGHVPVVAQPSCALPRRH